MKDHACIGGAIRFKISKTSSRSWKGGALTFSPRRMFNGTNTLNYNLYLDAARTVIWGDGTGGTQNFFVRNPQPNNQNISVPLYGRIPAGQGATVGNYSNTVTVTINF